MRKVFIALLLFLPLLAWAQGPFDGTWKVNLSNAQFSQKPEEILLKNGQYKCMTCPEKIDIKADGTDQKVPGAKGWDTLAVKVVDDNTAQFTRKKDGKPVAETTDKVSEDGNTLTVSGKSYPPQGEPVTWTTVLTRVGTKPQDAHAESGSWRMSKVENVSEQGMLITFKQLKDGLSMSQPTGESYEAKFDGKDYPVKSDRAGGTVALKKVNENTIQETYKQDGKPVSINEMTVAGKTMKIVSKDPRRGTTDTFTADKQQ